MGGNALRNFTSVRLEAHEFHEFEKKIVKQLQSVCSGHVATILSYRNKESFGDLDVLIESINYDPVKAARAINAIEVVRNGDVTSCGVVVSEDPLRVFQVDLIVASSDEYNFAFQYFSGNDLGNLIGRIAHRVKAKFGHNGMSYTVRLENNHKLGDIMLTQDFQEAIEFLGYDYTKYCLWFDDIEDIFKFASSTEFFHPDIYLLDNVNAVARIRDKKRKTYMEFLKWCEKQKFEPKHPMRVTHEQAREILFKRFPHAKIEYDNLMHQYEQSLIFKEKFNGEIVAELTGLKHKELGQFMAILKKKYLEIFKESTKEQIVDIITKEFNEQKSN